MQLKLSKSRVGQAFCQICGFSICLQRNYVYKIKVSFVPEVFFVARSDGWKIDQAIKVN